jgi:predicted  nucleic acid-binding Zn-ribbon protein
MAGIRDFLKVLPDTRLDFVVNVITDLQDSTSGARIEKLRQFLSALTFEIDGINRKRDALGQKVANIDTLLPILDENLKSSPDLEMELLRNTLLGWRASLKGEIAELRPNGKLEKKYDTERKRDLLIQLQSVASQLNEQMQRARGAIGLHPDEISEGK